MKKTIYCFILIIFFFCFTPRWSQAFASACFTYTSTIFTVTTSCGFGPTMPGVDAGTGTINTAVLNITSGALVTIDREIGTGSVTMTSGSVSIASQGVISLGKALYWADADGDGYIVDPAITPASFGEGEGKIRRSQASMPIATDCDDGDYQKYADAVCYLDADNDGAYSNTTTGAVCGNGISCPGASANPGTDCNDNANGVSYSHTQCYTDADGDMYTAGLAANTTCLNTAGCGTATQASLAGDGSPVTNYTAGTLRNAATATDCKEAGTNPELVWVTASCYVDADNDDYGGTTSKTCMNHTNCLLATAGSLGSGGVAATGDFSSVNTDCCDTDNRAKPVGNVCQATTNNCGVWDFDCDTVGGEHCSNTDTYNCDDTCNGSAGGAMIVTGGWVSGRPSCGNSANQDGTDESHSGGTCYAGETCASISYGAHGVTETCE